MSIKRKRPASCVGDELSCLYCGHDTAAPAWDAHGVPRCPRCAARLLIELRDRSQRGRTRPHQTHARADEEREDEYAREDVYVGAPETAD
ncbi:MAG TPA: hypothetical protein VI056_12005 [Candidatus Limnocylindria bacterium]